MATFHMGAHSVQPHGLRSWFAFAAATILSNSGSTRRTGATAPGGSAEAGGSATLSDLSKTKRNDDTASGGARGRRLPVEPDLPQLAAQLPEIPEQHVMVHAGHGEESIVGAEGRPGQVVLRRR